MTPTSATDAARPADVQATFAATLVDEWVRCGVSHAVVCPGSRSTPLALALAAADRIRLHVHHDERSGGFMALGIGLATGRPAVVLTTSGTAAVELHPSMVEADLAAVPLLACTADRPPELRDVGAPQAIDQLHLYGRAVRWFADPGVPDAATSGRWRAFAARAYAAAIGAAGMPGPVHLNLAFREPLVGVVGRLPPSRAEGPWTDLAPAQSDAPVGLGGLAGRRGVILAGAFPGTGEAVHSLASTLGWPVLADPRSPAWIPAPTTIAHVDALLRSARAAAALRPEVVLRLGPLPASRVVNEWLAGSGAEEIVVGAAGWSDPAGTAARVVLGSASRRITAWSEGGGPDGDPGPGIPAGWLSRWRTVADAAAIAVAGACAALPPPHEPGVARAVVEALPAGSTLVVSSSMPIRDVERYALPRTGVRVIANRGANGIDGVVSTAVGVAVSGSRPGPVAGGHRPSAAPTVLLIGDLAFLHDSNGLLGAVERGIDLACVVLDNDGGGIFSFLPQARALPVDRFETLFGTPHRLDLVALASAYGVTARRIGGDDVDGAVRDATRAGGVEVLVAQTDRVANVEAHRRIDDAVAAAVDRALASD